MDSSPDNYPGPGSYYPSLERSRSPSWSMSKASRDQSRQRSRSPGPGTYSIKQEFSKNAAVFGSSSRLPLINIQGNPGPGQYDLRKPPSIPAYTMRARLPLKGPEVSPGPGQYNPVLSPLNGKFYTFNTETGPKWSFGNEVREKPLKNSNPGPGAYEIFSSIANVPGYVRHRMI